MELMGMVGVIIVDLGTVVFSLVLKAAPGTVEVAEPLLHGAAGKAQHIGSGCGGQRVADIVLTADLQEDMGVFLAVNQNVWGDRLSKRYFPHGSPHRKRGD